MNTDERARWSKTTFMVAFLLTALLLLWVCSAFLVPLVIAVSAAILLSGVNERLVRALKGRRALAAFLMSTVTILILLGPVVLLIVALVQALVPLFGSLVDAISSGRLVAAIHERLPAEIESLINARELESQIGQALARVATSLGAFATEVPQFAAALSLDALISFLALYVYFARGPQLAQAIVEATPMERRYTRKLLDTIGVAVRTVFVASFITAIIQFVLGYIGFRIVGLPFAMALAGIMAFLSFIFSLIPVLGSGLVWVPAGIWLIATGRPIAGAFVLGWGALVLSSVDNVVKPLHAKNQMQLSPLLVFITLFGGISVFGPIGALLGPLIAALGAAFLRIWTTEFLTDAEPLPRVPTRTARRFRWPKLPRLHSRG